MVTLADIQRLVEQDKATIFITISPGGLKARPGDTICVSAGTNGHFYGDVTYGTDLDDCMERALKRRAPKTDILDDL